MAHESTLRTQGPATLAGTSAIGNYCRVGALVAMLVVAVASASAPKTHQFDKAMQTDASFDQTWSALIEVFADNNWAIQTIEKDSGLIATDWLRLDADSVYADCGGPGLATVVGREIRFNVFVRTEAAGAVVSVTATFRERRSFDGREGLVDCSSTGRVEADIHSQVDAIIMHRGPTPSMPPASPPAEKAAGVEGGPCYGNRTCNTGLHCDDTVNQCVAPPAPTQP